VKNERMLAEYPKYGDSKVKGIGEVPTHWRLKPIKYIATINDDVIPESTASDMPIEYIDISGVSQGIGIVETQDMTFGTAPSRARRVVQDGDLIISTVRTYLRAIAPIKKSPLNLIVSTGFAVLRPLQNLSVDFAPFAVQAQSFIDEVISRSVGVSYPAINASAIGHIVIPLPPLPEQKAIAAFLDRETSKIDTLIEKQQRLVTLLTEKRQAVIRHAVTKGLDITVPMKDSGIEWLGRVPAHWKIHRLKNLVSNVDQGWSPQCETYAALEGDWAVLKLGCVNDHNFNPTEQKALPGDIKPMLKYQVRPGDILMSRGNTRELVGMASLVERAYPGLLLSDLLYRFQVREKHPR